MDKITLSKVESLGRGVTRLHAADVGFADVAAVYSHTRQGWDVDVQHTNIRNPQEVETLVALFRASEGMPEEDDSPICAECREPIGRRAYTQTKDGAYFHNKCWRNGRV